MTHSYTLYRWLGVLLVLCAGTACKEEPQRTLSELATAAQAPPDIEENTGKDLGPPPPWQPVLTVVAVNPESLVARARTLLSLLPEYSEGGTATKALRLLQETASIYLEVEEFELAADREKEEIVLRSMPAMLLAVPGKGINPARIAATLVELLAESWPGTDGGGELRCEPQETGVVCVTHADRREQGVQRLNFSARAMAHLHMGGPNIRLTLQIRPLAKSAESFFTTPIFWGVVPEEFLTLTTIGATIDLESDRIELSIAGRDSAVLTSLEDVLTATGQDGRLPPNLPLLAYTTVDDLARRASMAEEHWDTKLRVPKAYRFKTFLDKSWQRQLVEMASGRVGVALAGPVRIGDVSLKNLLRLDSLIFFMQYADRKALEKRLDHIFASKYFRLEDEILETGEKLTRSMRRRGRKTKGEERMAWFFKDGFCFFGSTTEMLRDFAARMDTAAGAGTSLTTLELKDGEKLRLALSPGRIIQALQLPDKSGMTEKLALGIFKNSVLELTGTMRISLVATGEGATTRLAVRIESFFAICGAFLGKTGPLLKLLPGKGS